MPRLTIPSILSQCDTWLCPILVRKTQMAKSRIAHWVSRAACAFRLRRLSTESAHSLIERSMNRDPRPGEIPGHTSPEYGGIGNLDRC